MLTENVMIPLPDFVKYVSTFIFAVAIAHTFCVGRFAALARRYPEGSVRENLYHLLGEVEIVFGLWAGVFVLFLTAALSSEQAVAYVESRNYIEPIFVFVIMAVCATKPVLDFVATVMDALASALVLAFKPLGLKTDLAQFVVIMIAGPLLGSLITEPAAMTVCALVLLRRFYSRTNDLKLKYAMTGLLFVNISIGGTLTSFAAPPVLMVAKIWSWDSAFMFRNFGWKAVIAVIVSTLVAAFCFRKALANLHPYPVLRSAGDVDIKAPWWLVAIHAFFVLAIVLSAHHVAVFVGIFLFFLGVTMVTKEYQEPLQLKSAMLVGFFLGGLVVLGGPQGWWLEPLLARLQSLPLFLGATALTAMTDNAALTYLGSLVTDLSDASKYALVAGAVTGGGLTVIANAPNPAGYGILKSSFGDTGLSPLRLLAAAFVPTLIAAACFWWL